MQQEQITKLENKEVKLMRDKKKSFWEQAFDRSELAPDEELSKLPKDVR